MSRIEEKFVELGKKKQSAFIVYLMAGDPNLNTTLEILNSLPKNGVDIIELGMPFTDPIADGPSIQRAGQRSLKSGTTLDKIFQIIKEFRKYNDNTPIILMGYYNPIYSMGVDIFLSKAKKVGVDGLLVVDLPPEEDEELCLPAKKKKLDFIRLATPTTNEKRLKKILKNTTGFIYYVSIAGVTGNKLSSTMTVEENVLQIKNKTNLPICVGFGIRDVKTAKKISEFSDGIIIGSAIVEKLEKNMSVNEILRFCNEISISIKNK